MRGLRRAERKLKAFGDRIRNLGLKTAGLGTPVRLRETVEDVTVWVKNADGEPVAGRMDLYEGWYCLELESE